MKKYIVANMIYFIKGQFDKKEDAMDFARLLRVSDPDGHFYVFEMVEQ